MYTVYAHACIQLMFTFLITIFDGQLLRYADKHYIIIATALKARVHHRCSSVVGTALCTHILLYYTHVTANGFSRINPGDDLEKRVTNSTRGKQTTDRLHISYFKALI